LEPVEAPLLTEILPLIEAAGVPEHRHQRAREAMLRERLRGHSITTCWMLRLPPGASFWRQLLRARLPGRMILLVGSYAAEYVLWILSWWLIGLAALEGRFDRGWLLAWALLLLTIVPFRLLGSWLQGVISIGSAALLKQRLLYGALQLAPEEIRHQGAGQFLGQVLESEAVESLALSGGFAALIAAIELGAAMVVLGWGTGAMLLRILLSAWVLFTAFLAYICYTRRLGWTADRLRMTNDLIERMVGHRTRMVQQARVRWHEGEDEALERYLEVSEKIDRAGLWLIALVPRGWLIVGLLGLAPVFVSSRSSPVTLAIALGGILLAYRAFGRLSTGVWNLIDAAISWKQVAPLFHAAARAQAAGLPLFRPGEAQDTENRQKLVEGHELIFRYQDRGEPVLRKCNLSIAGGDRILLEGHSGGGKSTLASLLVGLRRPQSGLLLLEGLDWQTLGIDGWRRRIVSAPQFHENHVFTETFAFNLLMGRSWPASENEMKEAKEICHELGLDGLIERMPAGLLQMVGETGWQLSHGERSLLYVARALLQRAHIIILDESFAALDPETLRRSLDCVLRRAPTLMVIAHP
jgi:ATP-binding cassette, subfamily B, bacterial